MLRAAPFSDAIQLCTMTDKQEKILMSALQLFAEKGYDATSTSKVARVAGVSEGLIFRHFENKEGLLQAVLSLGREKADTLFAQVLNLSDPRAIIRKVLEIPFQIGDEQYLFWKLIYALKWQSESYDYDMSAPLRKKLEAAFELLNFENPEAEAELVLVIIDGLATAMLLRQPRQTEALKACILSKYDL